MPHESRTGHLGFKETLFTGQPFCMVPAAPASAPQGLQPYLDHFTSHLLLRSPLMAFFLPGHSSHQPAPCSPAWAPQPAPTLGLAQMGSDHRLRADLHVTYLPFQVSGFIRCGSWEDSWVTEAGAKQGPHHKEEQDATDHRDGGSDLHC